MNRPPIPRGMSLPPSEQQVRGAKWLMYLFVGLMALISAIMLSNLVVGWRTVTATITKVDAPRSCRSDRHVLFGPKERDWAPEVSVGYCGLVHTDQGSVRLPESNWVLFGPTTREILFDRLREGCRFKLRVHGYSALDGLEEPPPGQLYGDKFLWSVEPIGPCPEGAQGS